MEKKRQRDQSKMSDASGWGTGSEITHLEGMLSGRHKMLNPVPPEDPEWVLKMYLKNGDVREQQKTWGSVEWPVVRLNVEQMLQGLRTAEAGYESD